MSHNMDHDDHGSHDMGDMDMRMYMIINWEVEVAFIFKEWKSTNTGEFIFGLILTYLFMVLCSALPILKARAEAQRSLTQKIIWQLLFATQTSITMFLMMTVNGWVLLMLALGLATGNFVFFYKLPASKIDSETHDAFLK